MSRFLIPILLIAAAIGSYFLYTEPIYTEAKGVKADVDKLRDAEAKLADALKKRDELATKYNSLQPEDIARLEKLMPDNLDNIKLIIDVDRSAKKNGVILNAVKFDVDQRKAQENPITGRTVTTTDTTPIAGTNQSSIASRANYNTFTLTMTFTGSFASFTKLMAEIEKNLRIIDITSINFDAQDSKEVYKFEVKAAIYWLKNSTATK